MEFASSSSASSEVRSCAAELRFLEHQAIESVLRAFRAQGPLTLYKEVLLDHLRTALFIPRTQFAHYAEEAVHDKTLVDICHVLNPSYNSHSGWVKCSAPIFPPDVELHLGRLPESVTDFPAQSISNPACRRRFWEHIVEKEAESTAKLLNFPPKRFEGGTRVDIDEVDQPVRLCTNRPIPTKSVKRVKQDYDNRFESLESFDTFMKNNFKRTELPPLPLPLPPSELYNNWIPALSCQPSASEFAPVGRRTYSKRLSIYKRPGLVSTLAGQKFKLETEQEVLGLKALMYLKKALETRGSEGSVSSEESAKTSCSPSHLSMDVDKELTPDSISADKENVTEGMNNKGVRCSQAELDVRNLVNDMVDMAANVCEVSEQPPEDVAQETIDDTVVDSPLVLRPEEELPGPSNCSQGPSLSNSSLRSDPTDAMSSKESSVLQDSSSPEQVDPDMKPPSPLSNASGSDTAMTPSMFPTWSDYSQVYFKDRIDSDICEHPDINQSCGPSM